MLTTQQEKMPSKIITNGFPLQNSWAATQFASMQNPKDPTNMDNCGTLPDFGNFRIGKNKKTGKQDWYDRYMGMSALLPFAKAVSAKSHDFDSDGNETATDYLKVMQMVMDSGYHGWVGIEYEGGKLSEADGIKATKKLLESCRQQLRDT